MSEFDALATAECKVCGERVTRLEAPLHIEDHVQRGDLIRVGIDWNYDPTSAAQLAPSRDGLSAGGGDGS